jgi:hypothetical protein
MVEKKRFKKTSGAVLGYFLYVQMTYPGDDLSRITCIQPYTPLYTKKKLKPIQYQLARRI